MKVLIQLNKSALFTDKIYEVTPTEELDEQAFLSQIDQFDYNATDIWETLNIMNQIPAECRIMTEAGLEGFIFNITDFTPYELEKAIVKWSKDPKLQEIQKLRERSDKSRQFSKKKFTEYLMGGTGHLEKHTEQIKPEYHPLYKKLEAKKKADYKGKVYTKEEYEQIKKDIAELAKETGIIFGEVREAKKRDKTT